MAGQCSGRKVLPRHVCKQCNAEAWLQGRLLYAQSAQEVAATTCHEPASCTVLSKGCSSCWPCLVACSSGLCHHALSSRSRDHDGRHVEATGAGSSSSPCMSLATTDYMHTGAHGNACARAAAVASCRPLIHHALTWCCSLLQTIQEAALAFKQAAAQIKQTSLAVERALLVVELDVPGGVSAFEAVCAEVESVLRIINFLTGSKKKGKSSALPLSRSQVCTVHVCKAHSLHAGDQSQTGAVQGSGSAAAAALSVSEDVRHTSIQRVIKSITTMTNVGASPARRLQRTSSLR